MSKTKRRTFLGGAFGSLPLTLLGQTDRQVTQTAPIHIAAGQDRFGEHHTLGVSTTDFKVATRDARGGLFIMEHTNRKKGGVPLHLHHNEEEWFYVIEGNYLAQIGDERFRLNAGDSVLGPREVPHAWAFIGDTPGKLLIAFAPANKMEEYFRTFKARGGAYSNWNDPADKEPMHAYGMELLGPPIPLE